MKKIIFTICFVICLCLGFSMPVLADDGDSACLIDSTNPACQSSGDAFSIAANIINGILLVVGVIATFVIIGAGITMATSAGDAGKVKKAKNAVIYAAIGLAVSVLASVIVNFVLDGVFSGSSSSYLTEDECKKAITDSTKEACEKKDGKWYLNKAK